MLTDRFKQLSSKNKVLTLFQVAGLPLPKKLGCNCESGHYSLGEPMGIVEIFFEYSASALHFPGGVSIIIENSTVSTYRGAESFSEKLDGGFLTIYRTITAYKKKYYVN